MPPVIAQNITSMNTVGATLTVAIAGQSTVGIESVVNNNVTWLAEGSPDGQNFNVPLTLFPLGGGAGTLSVSNVTGSWSVVPAGMQAVRVRVTAVGGNPNATFTMVADTGVQVVYTVAQSSGSQAATTTKFRNLGAQIQLIKAIGGTLYGVRAINNSGLSAFLQLFNALPANVTLGQTAPDYEFQVSDGSLGRHFTDASIGIAFGTAICIASTITEGGSTGSPNGVHVFPQFL